MRWLALAGAGIVVLLSGWWWHQSGGKAKAGSASGNVAAPPQLEDERTVFAQYGGSVSCRGCHEEAFALWEKSNHALAERSVQPEHDRTAFDPLREFKHGTQTSEARWTNDIATVTSTGLSGQPETHAVARVIGNDPLRQFLVPFPAGAFRHSKLPTIRTRTSGSMSMATRTGGPANGDIGRGAA